MKKTTAICLGFVFILLSFCGCKNNSDENTSVPPVNQIKSSLEFYNQKALDNINSLIGTPTDNVEEWIYETYSADEIIKADYNNNSAPAFLSKDETIKIFFVFDNEETNFFIEPNTDKYDLANSKIPFVDSEYNKTTWDYCFDNNANYKDAPLICELSLYNFDKADTSTTLTYHYNFNEDGIWGAEGLFNTAIFSYKDKTFILKTNED